MFEADILRSLQQGVTAAVAASTVPTLPVSYVQSGFPNNGKIPADQKWLEVVWLPNNVQGDLWGGEKNYRGILRLILHWPNDRSSPYGPLGLIGSIGDYFYKGRLLGAVQCYEGADLTGGALPNESDVLFPLTIRYASYRRDQ